VAWTGWQIVGAISGGLAAIYLLFKPSKAGAATMGPCGDWKGDTKALQSAMNVALQAKGRPTIAVDGKPGAQTCKAAKWLVENEGVDSNGKKILDEFLNSKTCGCGLPRAPCGIGGPTASKDVRDQIIAAGVKKGYPASDVNKAVSRESGWHAQALNCQGADKHPVAGGLMGFLDSVARHLGFEGSIDQFAMLTAEQQLPYCLKFVAGMPASCLHLPGDFGLALFTPAYVCKPDEFVIFEVGTVGWEQNPGLRENGNGPVTAGKVRSTAR